MKITIVIPCYNGEKFIESCIDSLIKQTFNDFDILVVNDGSKDNSKIILEDLQQKHKRLKVINIENGGVTHARKLGVQHADGEWITFVDVDDTLEPNALVEMYSLTNDDTDLVVQTSYDEKAWNLFSLHQIRSKAITWGGYPPAPWGKLFRKSIFNDFIFDIPREIYYGEDYLMNIRYLYQTNKKPVFTQLHLYNYTINSSSVSLHVKRTLDYELILHRYRIASLPKSDISLMSNELIENRIDRIRDILIYNIDEVSNNKSSHPHMIKLLEDIKNTNYKLSIFDFILLKINSKTAMKGLVYYQKMKSKIWKLIHR